MRRSRFAVSALVVVLAVFGAACSDDSESAEEAVCNDASDLKSSVNQLVDDIMSANLGDASDQMAAVKSDFDALASSAKNLAASKRASVQDDLDAVKSQLDDLSSASSIDDVRRTLSSAESQLKDSADSVTQELSC